VGNSHFDSCFDSWGDPDLLVIIPIMFIQTDNAEMKIATLASSRGPLFQTLQTKRKTEPNKAMQPSRMSVTMTANALIAPALRLADLWR
jgi:hypothetical protein